MNAQKTKLIFFVAISVLCLVPIALFWGLRPLLWADSHSEPTIEQAAQEFPIHFAALPPSSVHQHLVQIEDEELRENIEFNAIDWALREIRYRLFLLLILWVASGFFIRWFTGQILQDKREF